MSEERVQYSVPTQDVWMFMLNEYDTGVDDISKLGICLDNVVREVKSVMGDLSARDYIFCEKAILQLLADLKRRRSEVEPLDAAVADYKDRTDS